MPSGFGVTTHGGRTAAGSGRDRVGPSAACDLGVGEILLNSMDADGTTAGFDLEMIAAVRAVVDVPLIASGGRRPGRGLPAGGRRRGRRGARRQRLPLRHTPDRRGQGGVGGRRIPGSRPAIGLVPARERVTASELTDDCLFCKIIAGRRSRHDRSTPTTRRSPSSTSRRGSAATPWSCRGSTSPTC